MTMLHSLANDRVLPALAETGRALLAAMLSLIRGSAGRLGADDSTTGPGAPLHSARQAQDRLNPMGVTASLTLRSDPTDTARGACRGDEAARNRAPTPIRRAAPPVSRALTGL